LNHREKYAPFSLLKILCVLSGSIFFIYSQGKFIMLKKMLWGIIITLAGLWIWGERGRLIRSSTLAMIREGGGWRYAFSTHFIHAYVYGRWTKQYIGWSERWIIPRTHPIPGKNQWADQYHGKIVPTELAKALITINEDIVRCNLNEQLIPFPVARDLVLKTPVDVVAYECGCRGGREHPCQPSQVCMVIGKPFTDFVLEHNPQSSRRLTQQEALDLLQAEHERGHMHAAYFKDVLYERMYAICNCCKCCCAGLESMRHGVPMKISSGYVAQIEEMACQGCGTCAEFCPFEAIEVNGSASILWDTCMGCGVCESQCPNDAITLVLDARKGLPLDVRGA
jgi:Pyruvate/2-oxoacid:ferredoxin oxidoreductase delta subunit